MPACRLWPRCPWHNDAVSMPPLASLSLAQRCQHASFRPPCPTCYSVVGGPVLLLPKYAGMPAPCMSRLPQALHVTTATSLA
eukprot:238226-Chlamydomonas_euryale.AAC.1